MDIKMAVPSVSPVPSGNAVRLVPAASAANPAPAEKPAASISASQGSAGPELALPVHVITRAELGVDQAAHRVVARVVDRDSNSFLRQYPSEEMLRLLAKTREQIESLLAGQA